MAAPLHIVQHRHLRRTTTGDMVTTYLESFDRIWTRAEH